MKGVVQRIFSDHFPLLRLRQGFSLDQYRASLAIMQCRTAALGGHIQACPDGHIQRIHYNSCKHRCCPLCAFIQLEAWLRGQVAKLIACHYYHVIFTIPHQLNILWRYNRRLFSHLFLQAAWHSLRDLLTDSRHLGALPGALATLHTWDQRLGEHIHVHMLVTAGGINPDGRWIEVRAKCLVYQPLLAAKFRGKFLACLRSALEHTTNTNAPNQGQQGLVLPPAMSPQGCHNLLNKLSKNAGKKWHVQIQPRYHHGHGVIHYLARYVKGGPIGEGRIVAYDGHTVTIRSKRNSEFEDRPHAPRGNFPLTAEHFIQRFLAHVPPRYFHTVRSFGLFHPRNRQALNAARRDCHQAPYEKPEEPTWEEIAAELPAHQPERCPVCGKALIVLGPLAPSRSPPCPRSKAA